MKADKAGEQLKVIRQLMERPVRYSTMSGVSGILAGAAALVGLALDQHFWTRLAPNEALVVNMFVWGGVFVAALTAALVLTRLREKRQGMPFWSPVKRRILSTILPPFVAAIGLTAAVAGRFGVQGGWDTIPQGYLIPAIWMLFYGVALWQVGQFSPVEVRLLGAGFIAAGLATAAVATSYPYWAMGITFGGFHVVYGVGGCVRHGG